MNVEVKYDKKVDSVYLHFSDAKVAYSKKLDTERSVDYSAEGEIRGIQFSSASSGLKTDDLPHRTAIDRAIYEKGIAGFNAKPAVATISSLQNAGDSGKSLQKVRVNARIIRVLRAIAIVLFFTGVVAADILFMRNLLALSSVTLVLVSVLGLMVTLLPTVFGLLLLFAWIILATGLATRYEDAPADKTHALSSPH